MKKFSIIVALIITLFASHLSVQETAVSAQPSISTPTEISQPLLTDRGRPQIVDGTLKTDNGLFIRGEHLRVTTQLVGDGSTNTHIDRGTDPALWDEMVNDYHLNAVRLLIYRPPQRWYDEDPDICPDEGINENRCFDTVFEALPYIDAFVDLASSYGMYAIIDYHPVGGYYESDAESWWNVLAPHYKNRTHVIYEATNEPVAWSSAGYNPTVIDFIESTYTRIRGHAPNSPILLWTFAETHGSPAASMLAKVMQANTINYDNALVAFHPYQTHNYSEPNILALKDNGYPIINSEIGGSSRNNYVNRTAAAESIGVSWIWLDGTGYGKDWAEDNPLIPSWPKDPLTGAQPEEVTVSITPNSGSYINSVTISLSSSSNSADIYYTIDGSNPNQSDILYSQPFIITSVGNTTVKARAYTVDASSDIESATFTVLIPSDSTFIPLMILP